MNDRFDPKQESAVRRALAREADQVRPDPYALDKIRRRVAKPVRSRRSWLFPAAAAVVGAAAAVGAFAVLTQEQPTADGPEIAGVPSSPSQSAPAESATTGPQPTQSQATAPQSSGTPRTSTAPKTVPVYWLGTVVGRPDLGPRLYRTFTAVEGDPLTGAVRAMVAGDAGDPDYSSAWVGAKVNSATSDRSVTTVDFGALPAKALGSEASATAVQELVYTVNAVLQNTNPVQVTLNGGPAGALFGHVDSSRPIARAAAIDVQAFVWITAPVEGATTGSPVTVTGVASTFEATVNWRVRDAASKAVVKESSVQATAGSGAFGTFRFAVPLPPGRYVVECLEYSAADGHETNTDTKTITVK